jgi:hypothetical protein
MKGVLTERPTHPVRRPRVVHVDNRAEVREFLVSRRAKITPQEAGFPVVGSHRRARAAPR